VEEARGKAQQALFLQDRVGDNRLHELGCRFGAARNQGNGRVAPFWDGGGGLTRDFNALPARWCSHDRSRTRDGITQVRGVPARPNEEGADKAHFTACE
jgi:hypothetical protein